jgi:WD40 repeat protein
MRTFALVLLTLCCWTPTFIGEAQRTPDELAEITRENADQIGVLSILEVGGWAMDVSSDGTGEVFAVYNYGSDRSWIRVLGIDVSSPYESGTIGLGNEEYTAVAFTSDGSQIVYGDEFGNVSALNLKTGNVAILPLPHEHAILDMANDPDGTILAVASNDVPENGEPRSFSLLDLSDYSSVCRPADLPGPTKAVSFSPVASIVAVSAEYTIILWSYQLCQEVDRLEMSNLFSRHIEISFTSDGQHLLALNRSIIDIWSISESTFRETPRSSYAIYNQTGWDWLTMAISPNDEIIAVAGYERVVYLYDLNTGELVTSIESEDIVRDLAFSPDGTKLSATGFDKGVTTEYGIVAPGEGG